MVVTVMMVAVAHRDHYSQLCEVYQMKRNTTQYRPLSVAAWVVSISAALVLPTMVAVAAPSSAELMMDHVPPPAGPYLSSRRYLDRPAVTEQERLPGLPGWWTAPRGGDPYIGPGRYWGAPQQFMSPNHPPEPAIGGDGGRE